MCGIGWFFRNADLGGSRVILGSSRCLNFLVDWQVPIFLYFFFFTVLSTTINGLIMAEKNRFDMGGVPCYAPGMPTTPKTTVITDPEKKSITINGKERLCYKSRFGLRCFITHSEVRSLGFAPRVGENYEILNGNTLRTLASSEFREIQSLPKMDSISSISVVTINPLFAPRSPKKSRGPSRIYQPLVDAAREIAPILPPSHRLRIALDRIDSIRQS